MDLDGHRDRLDVGPYAPNVADLFSTAIAAGVVFVGTDVDDILVLTVLFAAAKHTGRPHPWQIVAGQYAGIAILVAASAIGAAGLLVVPDPWPGLLGLLPIALGVRALLTADEHDSPTVVSSALGVAGVTVANGADNIAVYVPVFRTLGPARAGVLLLVFVALVALWCAAAAWLGGHPRVAQLIDRVGHWLVPAVFITIGVLILIGSGLASRLVGAHG